MFGRNSTILNSIIDATARSMSQSIYDNAMSTVHLNHVSKGYNTTKNTQFARGIKMAIVCGRESRAKSRCGSESEPTGEECKLK